MSNESSEPYFGALSPTPSSLLNGQTAHHCFFAATIDTIPDLSSYPEFEHVDLLDQLRRVLDTQRLLLIGLAQQEPQLAHARALDLRYIFQPDRPGRRLTIALLGKGVALTADQAREEASRLWLDVVALFPRHLYRSGLVPVRDHQMLEHIRCPIKEGQRIVTIQKRVELTRLLRLPGTHPVAYPLRWGLSPMREFCKTMLQAQQPCMLSSALAPATLALEERQALNTIAGRLRRGGEGREHSRRMGMASSLASGEKQAQLQSQVGQERELFLPDPQAQINGEIYEQSLRQLDHALLWRCYIVSQGELPRSVSGAFVAEIVGTSQATTASKEPAPPTYLPAEVLLIGDERRQAITNLDQLEFAPHAQHWEGHDAGELAKAYQQLTRLPTLIDVQEASCVFKLPCLPTRDEIGIPLHSGAFVSQAPPKIEGTPELLTIGEGADHTPWHIKLEDLTRHTLVAGTTGSGKTTSCLNLLEGLMRNKPPIPFLVLEPVNAEHNDYRALLSLPNTPHVNLFTLGDEHVAPFRLNPFAMAKNITAGEHIAALMTCFKAALPMWEPLPRIFLKALRRTYYRAGWGPSRKAGKDDDPTFPTIYDFYAELCLVVDSELEHSGEVRDNIRGATKLRVEALIESSCGRILATRESLPAAMWLEQPTILELRHIGDDEDRALMSAFVLLALREHCEATRQRQGGLQHITLVEEAHRLLGQAPEGASAEVSSIKGQAAASFAQMLAETRKYGEGLIIAEQLPTKLVPDVLGNTGLKLMHRLTAKEDREVMGRAMRFTPFQEDHVAGLSQGQAALYATAMEAPVLITIEGARWDALRRNAPDDEQVRKRMEPLYASNPMRLLPFEGCALCPAQCRFRDDGEALAADRSRGYESAVKAIFAAVTKESHPETTIAYLVACSDQLAEQASGKGNPIQREGIAFCAFLHVKARSDIFRGFDGMHWSNAFRKAQAERGNKA
ncbi:MAG: ATP-binding protein [Chloroflexales bacterium]